MSFFFLSSSTIAIDGGDTVLGGEPIPITFRAAQKQQQSDPTAAWMIPTGLPAFDLGFLGQDPPPRNNLPPRSFESNMLTPVQPPLYVQPGNMALWQPQDPQRWALPPSSAQQDATGSPQLFAAFDPILIGSPWQVQQQQPTRLPLQRRGDLPTVLFIADAPPNPAEWGQQSEPRRSWLRETIGGTQDFLTDTSIIVPNYLAAIETQPPGLPNCLPSRATPWAPSFVELTAGILTPPDSWIDALSGSSARWLRFPIGPKPDQSGGVLEAWIAETASSTYSGWDVAPQPQPRLPKQTMTGETAFVISDASLLSTINIAFQQDPEPPPSWVLLTPEKQLVSEPEPWLSGSGVPNGGGGLAVIVCPPPYTIVAIDVYAGGMVATEVVFTG